jgi:hypothetical protein
MSQDVQIVRVKRRRRNPDVEILGITHTREDHDEQIARQLQQEWNREQSWMDLPHTHTYEDLLALSERIGPAISPSLSSMVYTQFPITKTKSECEFCIGEYKLGMVLPCQHVFHKKCIVKWFQQSKKCPMYATFD